MELWELNARECIRDTIARYNHAGDRGKFDDMVDCFIDDGVLEIYPSTRHVGRRELRSFFGNVTAGDGATSRITVLRHCITNVLINVQSPTKATSRAYFQVITDVGLDHWGTYRDRLVADTATGPWLFAERSVKTDGYTDGSFFRG
jgi:hypothetical protein